MTRSSLAESTQLLVLFLGYCLAVIEGELRCYCNESGCVATGYMCKSGVGLCFTRVEVRGEQGTTHQTHGCLDTLSEEHQLSCLTGVDVVGASRAGGRRPVLVCCTEHMCNYRQELDVSEVVTWPPRHNRTQGSRGQEDSHPLSGRDEERELWFKAAVIAVPIAGGFILVLLVLLAVRILRRDSLHHHLHHQRLIHIRRRQRSLSRAHSYLSQQFCGNKYDQQFSLFHETNNSNSSSSRDAGAVYPPWTEAGHKWPLRQDLAGHSLCPQSGRPHRHTSSHTARHSVPATSGSAKSCCSYSALCDHTLGESSDNRGQIDPPNSSGQKLGSGMNPVVSDNPLNSALSGVSAGVVDLRDTPRPRAFSQKDTHPRLAPPLTSCGSAHQTGSDRISLPCSFHGDHTHQPAWSGTDLGPDRGTHVTAVSARPSSCVDFWDSHYVSGAVG